jgi:hypothetical protein
VTKWSYGRGPCGRPSRWAGTGKSSASTRHGRRCYSLWADIPGFSEILRAKAEAGARVRFVLGDPDSELTRLTEQAERTPLTVSARIGHTLHELEPLRDVVEVRKTFLCWGKGVTRCDDEAILTTTVLGRTGTDAPRLHLRRRQDGGIFDQMAVRHVEGVWEAATPVWE